MTRTIRKGRLAKLIALGASAMLLATMVGQVSADGHVAISYVSKASVPSGFGDGWDCANGTKIDPVESGVYDMIFNPGGYDGDIEITVRSTSMGPVFDFETDSVYHVITAVLVKGGPGANLYTYTSGVSSDTGLHAPLNPNNPNNQWYGLSHLCFKSLKTSTPG